MADDTIHLREIFKTGIAMETQGEAFYNGLAENAKDPKAKSLFNKLAQAERHHKELIESILVKWEPLAADKGSGDLLAREVKFRGIFANPPSEYSAEEDAVKYAIDQEKKMADFYRSFESIFSDPWKMMHISQMVAEEMGHIKNLVTLYPQFKTQTA